MPAYSAVLSWTQEELDAGIRKEIPAVAGKMIAIQSVSNNVHVDGIYKVGAPSSVFLQAGYASETGEEITVTSVHNIQPASGTLISSRVKSSPVSIILVAYNDAHTPVSAVGCKIVFTITATSAFTTNGFSVVVFYELF